MIIDIIISYTKSPLATHTTRAQVVDRDLTGLFDDPYLRLQRLHYTENAMFRKRATEGFDATGSAAGEAAASPAAAAPLSRQQSQLQPSAGGERQPSSSPAVNATTASASPPPAAAAPPQHAARRRVSNTSGSGDAAALAAAANSSPARTPAALASSPAAAAQQQPEAATPLSPPPSAFTTYANVLFAPATSAAAADGQQLQQQTTQPAVAPQPQHQNHHQRPPSKPKQPPAAAAAAAIHADASGADQSEAAVDDDQAAPPPAGPRYAFDPDTGLLSRVGEGEGREPAVRRFVEDWRTGNFYLVQAMGEGGWLGWLRLVSVPLESRSLSACLVIAGRKTQAHNPRNPSVTTTSQLSPIERRRRPTRRPSDADWESDAGGGVLRSVSEFAAAMGHWCAVLGFFAQGLCGGLALLAFFQTYLLSATAGSNAFLGSYSPIAQNVGLHGTQHEGVARVMYSV